MNEVYDRMQARSSLARLQRGVLLAWGAALLAGLGWVGWADGASRGAWVAVGLLLGGHAAAVAAELLCARAVHGADAGLRATWGELARAWWTEIRWGVRVFAWQQPFRWRQHPDSEVPAPGRPAVVLVHGFVGNRGFWLPWLVRLSARGVPFVTVNLEPVFGGIDDYAAQIEAAVRRAEALTGVQPLLVGHSMGGLAVRAWMAGMPEAPGRVAHVVTIGSPHGGTWLARWSRTDNGRQMRLDSPWLRALAERERAQRPAATYAGFTCWHGNADNVVFPPPTATLPGGDNRLLRGVSHVAMAFEPVVVEDALARLALPPDPR